MRKIKKMTSEDYFKLADENLEDYPLIVAKFICKGIKKKREEMKKKSEEKFKKMKALIGRRKN